MALPAREKEKEKKNKVQKKKEEEEEEEEGRGGAREGMPIRRLNTNKNNNNRLTSSIERVRPRKFESNLILSVIPRIPLCSLASLLLDS